MKRLFELAAVTIIAFAAGAGSYASRSVVEDGTRFRFVLKDTPDDVAALIRKEIDRDMRIEAASR